MGSRKIERRIKIFCLFTMLALICLGTIGCPPGGGAGDDDDDDDGSTNSSTSSIVGNWTCSVRYTDSLGGQHTNYFDINYYSNNTYYSDPDESPCNYHGAWSSTSSSITHQITSVLGTESYCTIDYADTDAHTGTILELRDDIFRYVQNMAVYQYNYTCY